MNKSTLHVLSQPESKGLDPLHEIIRQGASALIAASVETELAALLETKLGTHQLKS